MDKHIAQFKCQPWHPLTELPGTGEDFVSKSPSTPENKSSVVVDKPKTSISADKDVCNRDESDALANLSSDAKTLLYNIVFKLELSVSQRNEMLNFSGRAGENAKHELITQGWIIESVCGRKKNLIPKPEAFNAFGLICPYVNVMFIEHSFYLHVGRLKLKDKKTVQSASLEYKIGTSGHTADIVTKDCNGILVAHEMTLSASNILQNCLKYKDTAFSKIIFLCKNSDLKNAVKSKVLNGGLPLDLLSKIDFMLLSLLLKEEKKRR